MSVYETTARVENHGLVQVAGVPFAAGTEVDVSISPKAGSQDEARPGNDPALTAARDRMRELFGTIRGFRNSPRIPREELYERGSLR